MRLSRSAASVAIGALLAAVFASCPSAAPTATSIEQTLTLISSSPSATASTIARRHNLACHNLACHNLARDRLGERAVTRLRGDVVRNARDRGRRIGRAFGAIVPHGPGTADGPPCAPVIVLFHGFADTAANIVDMSGIGTIAVGHGVIVVAPEATGSPPSWHIGQSEFGDVQFTDAVLALVRASSWRRHECHLVGRLQCRVGVGGCVRLLAHARYCGDLDALWTAAADLPVGHHTQHHDGARNR